MDALSRVLARTSILDTQPIRLEAGGAFSLRYAASRSVRFGRVERGELWVWEDSGPRHHLAGGDCFVLATGAPCVIASAAELRPGDGAEVCRTSEDGVARIGVGREVLLEGGLIELDPASLRLMHDMLSPVVVMPGSGDDAVPVQAALRRFFAEARTDRPGGSFAAGQLGQLVCLAALRRVLDDTLAPPGALAALTDPDLGATVRSMHADPGRRWTVDQLANLAHLSRSSFATRFRTLTGDTPVAYLASVRMRIAEHEIQTTDRTIASIGADLGYGSEAAFSRAFRRATGSAPSQRRSAVPPSSSPPAAHR